MFIALLDKKAYGEITCNGEDRDDLWKITLENGEVNIHRGYVEYGDGEIYDLENIKGGSDDEEEDKAFKKLIYENIEDKELKKKLIADML